MQTYGDVANLVNEVLEMPKGLPKEMLKMSMRNALIEIWANLKDNKFFVSSWELTITEEGQPLELSLPSGVASIRDIEIKVNDGCVKLDRCAERPTCAPPKPPAPVNTSKCPPKPRARWSKGQDLQAERAAEANRIAREARDKARALASGGPCWWCETAGELLLRVEGSVLGPLHAGGEHAHLADH